MISPDPVAVLVGAVRKSAPPFASRLGGQDVSGQLSGQRLCRYRGPGMSGIGQGVEGHHELQLNVDVGGCGLSGDDAFHEVSAMI